MSIRKALKSDVDTVVRMGKLMHGESHFKDLPFEDDTLSNFLNLAITSDEMFFDVFCDDGEIIGTLIGVLAPYVFCSEKNASDIALFVYPDKRGGVAAARLIKSFECWGYAMGAKQICMGVSTGVRVEQTHRLMVGLGYTHCGGVFKKGEI